MSKILVLDNEKEIAEVIGLYLKNDGYEVELAYSGLEALQKIAVSPPDLALLDVMLPDIDGFRVLQKIRENYKFPVIMLTAKTEDTDKINGLTLGADDYIPKPFNPLEMVARVKAQLRRYTKYNGTNAKTPENVIDFAGLLMNRDTHECTFNESNLALTPIEFDILWLLGENRGKVVSSEQIFEQIWKEKYFKNSNNTVMVHIRHLREKMGDGHRKSDFIRTVWGVGYKIEK
ncbi:MAG: VanR-ABDEGLN family response regulator transcription factor [Lachnospiraceae bacterium]|nr:VanR-ABDEGLN family response regulator transcription factor [Lachnospiraceae bacterium]